MDPIEIKETIDTPYVKFDPASSSLKIIGRSSPKDASAFYGRLIRSLEKYIRSGGDLKSVTFAFEYFNLSSSKCLLDILKRIKLVPNRQLIIKWYYEPDDVDMLEAGEDFATLLNIKFNFLEVESLN